MRQFAELLDGDIENILEDIMAGDRTRPSSDHPRNIERAECKYLDNTCYLADFSLLRNSLSLLG